MIPNITTGSRMAGLMIYLVDTRSEQTANVHTSPQLVAASDGGLADQFGHTELSKAGAVQIARQLDTGRRLAGRDPQETNVWHVSLSLHPDERVTQEQWSQIAGEFIADMQLADDPEDVQWVAVHHGTGNGGHDHIHLAVSTTTDAGRQINRHNDHPRSQKVCRGLERRHKMFQLEHEREQNRTHFNRDAAESAQRRGRDEPEKDTLERIVRSAAVASSSEAEFVRRLRQGNVLAQPRWTAGDATVASGYKVALEPPGEEQPIWHGGGRLARDLTLPKLRAQFGWTESADPAAQREWWASKRQAEPAEPTGPETRTVNSPKVWHTTATRIGEWNDRLTGVPLEDVGAWRHTQRQAAGVFAAWADRTDDPTRKAAFGDAEHALSQDAGPPPRPDHRSPPVGFRSAAALLLQTGLVSRGGAVGQAVVLRQLLRTMQAVADMQAAVGRARHARRIRELAAGPLRDIHRDLYEHAGPQPAHSPSTLSRTPTSSQVAGRPARPRRRPPSDRGRDPGIGR